MVQPNLRSSYMQWGFGSLSEDVEDMTALLDFLVESRGAKSIAICGHSTGSQIIAHLMRTRPHEAVSHVIFQGGVSDRESDDAEVDRQRSEALAMAQTVASSSPSGSSEMMPRSTSWAPVTAQRYIDLNSLAGTDDYFSSDLTDEQLVQRFGGYYSRTNALIAYSGEDEYVPKYVDKHLLVRRLCTCMKFGSTMKGPVIAGLVVKGGDHALYAQESADEFVTAAAHFLNGRPIPNMVD